MNRRSTRIDERWMQRALKLARRGAGLTRPNPPVGAVVARNGKLVGEGFHERAGGNHAEVIALRGAGGRARNATLYVTLEPCSTWGRTGPCTEEIVRSGIRRVVMATLDPNPRHSGRALGILKRAGIVAEVGTLRKEADLLIAPFAKWMTRGMAYVTVKLGMSLDGKIADFCGRSKWITSETSRSLVNEMRRGVDTVMIGARTAILDDPSLLCRGDDPQHRLMRIIVDARGRIPLTARVLRGKRADQTIIAVTNLCSERRRKRLSAGGCTVWKLPSEKGLVSLRALLKQIAKAGLLHVLCEGGGELVHGLIREGCVDEYVFFIAPCIIGGTKSTPAVGGNGWPLKNCPRLRFTKYRRIGADLMIKAVPE